jgi:hypothetical protein
VTIFRRADGTFALECSDGATRAIENLQTFDVAGRPWRFSCPEDLQTVSLCVSADTLETRNVELAFSVSSDEEHVRLRMHGAGRTFDLGSRNHNYLLLTLARARMRDAERGLPDPACGWVSQDEFAHDPAMSPPQLNLDVFRIRKQFGRVGVVDSANVVERRPGSRQFRIGTGRLTILRE